MQREVNPEGRKTNPKAQANVKVYQIWTAEENVAIMTAIKKYGKNYAKITAAIKTRS